MVSVTIKQGESLSSSADLTASTLMSILLPRQWTPALLSVQISVDNQTFYDLFDEQGDEIPPMPQESDRVIRLVTT
jgi:hypothetical protein